MCCGTTRGWRRSSTTEQTSWLLFLKYLDDLEAEREDTAALEGQDYTPILAEPYRWQAWAAPKIDGKLDHNAALTGADLIDFVNRELFPYLRKFRETTGDPDTIGEIFSEIVNKFRSGYSLRDALEIVDQLDFGSHKAKHELSDLPASSAWATPAGTAASTTRPAPSSAP